MVHVLIYLDVEKSPMGLVEKLLSFKLISSASIDLKNERYTMKKGKLVKQTKNVITAQTKSLLFDQIETFIANEYSEKVPVLSVPIIASNRIFESSLLNSTKKI